MFKKILSILTCLIFVQSFPVFSQNNEYSDYPVITGIERNVFGSTFQYNNIYQRINRLETAVLGTNFPQEALIDRIDRIKNATAGGNSYAYNSPSMQQYINQSPLGSSWQSIADSFSDNSSYNNQYYNTSQNTTGLQKVLEYALPILNSLAGNNNYYNNSGYNNYGYSPNYTQDYSGFRNTNYGVGVRILP
ncbi:MAG TPA: hypothetical protein DDW90_00510 [Cyanobacteria bacterium UBA9971]|nr:hypothetical protein [Cyanobacteria bacterium UBA9971]